MTFGRPDPGLSYPAKTALYQISVRRNKPLPSASFRFHLTMDTLAFGYEIPVITALSGLAPVGGSICPARPNCRRYAAKPHAPCPTPSSVYPLKSVESSSATQISSKWGSDNIDNIANIDNF
jgi:hypothetical protein